MARRKLVINIKVQVMADWYRDVMCHEIFALMGMESELCLYDLDNPRGPHEQTSSVLIDGYFIPECSGRQRFSFHWPLNKPER